MKILQLTASLSNGGAEKFLVELSNELARDHQVAICSVAPVEDWMYPPKKIASAVKLIELNCTKKYSLHLFKQLYQLVKNEQPDVVHVHASILMVYFWGLSLCFRNIRYIQTIHSALTTGYKKILKLYNRIWFINNRFLHVCIANSIYQECRSHFPRLKFTRIDNGIQPLKTTNHLQSVQKEISNYKFTEQTRVFIAIGNYSPFKNFEMLADAFAKIRQLGYDAILLVIGEDKLDNQHQYKKVAQKCPENMHLIGSREHVADYLFYADALVLSSTKEGMPLVVLEAFSVGVPIISTPAGGLVDLLKHNENGILATGFDNEALAKAIKQFLELGDASLKTINENNLQKFEQKYSIKICVKKYVNIYKY